MYVPGDGWQQVDLFYERSPIELETTDVGITSADATRSGNARWRVLGENGGFSLVRV